MTLPIEATTKALDALRIIQSDEAPYYPDQEDACEELAEALADGAEIPFYAGNLTEEFMGLTEGMHIHPTACAVRVAIAYGDMSGLEGLGYQVKR